MVGWGRHCGKVGGETTGVVSTGGKVNVWSCVETDLDVALLVMRARLGVEKLNLAVETDGLVDWRRYDCVEVDDFMVESSLLELRGRARAVVCYLTLASQARRKPAAFTGSIVHGGKRAVSRLRRMKCSKRQMFKLGRPILFHPELLPSSRAAILPSRISSRRIESPAHQLIARSHVSIYIHALRSRVHFIPHR